MQKRLAFISYHTCPLADHENREIGGMNTYVFELAKELAQKGYSIDIFTRSQDLHAPQIVEVLPNLRVIHLIGGKQEPLHKKMLIKYTAEFSANMYAFIEQQKITYSLISAHYYLSGMIGLKIKKKLHIPLFMTFHTLGIMKNLVAKGEEEREDVLRIKLELSLVQESDCVIATSNLDAHYLETLYNCPKKKLRVLWPGVNLQQFKPMDKRKAKEQIYQNPLQKIILFSGRVEPLKGIDVLLYAIKILLTKTPKLDLAVLIVGGNIEKPIEQWSKELKKLEALKKLLNVSTVVKFVGKKERKELVYYYNAADLVVMPSQYESFGLTALEAMACATPVITTDVTGVSGIFDKKHSVLITSANNPLMLAAKIKQVLCNENEYQKLSKEVRETVEDLSWKDLADKFIQIISVCK